MRPRWGWNPHGYEQAIGPDQQRTGRREPSSCACDRGHVINTRVTRSCRLYVGYCGLRLQSAGRGLQATPRAVAAGHLGWAICKVQEEAKGGDQRGEMPKGTGATERAKGGVEGWRQR
jgi:hypothetical protein